ncbi:uncharacterized protein DUF4249 [Chitinophaga polysaccharea]|uniref:Uncharacterized protein DUF4249 n=1 Tax=Chitinophaga polysaccharea TaxID=1293035 RepID=A0A561Q4W0_9BACT|nr:DUF4249 domain-containing protein [Chitinophaga polysaccharea]TWF45376.1 uncharacterized protein DUF4249 [Chitinophaga polysaccharea]
MNKIYFFVGAILLVCFLQACEKRENVTLLYEGNKIVVNTLIQPDSVIYTRVTRSVPSNVLIDGNNTDVSGASVQLLEDGVPLASPEVQTIKGMSYYVSGSKAVLGKRYEVRVAVPGMQAVTAMDTLPAAPLASAAAAQINSNRIRFTLKDCPTANNYYRIRIYISNPDGSDGSFAQFRLDPAFNNNLVDFFAQGASSSLIMSDERFNGKEVNFVLQTNNPIAATTQITLEVSALTYNTYQYLNTLTTQLRSGEAVISQPVRVFTNVANGYGIVGGINTKKLVFKAE